MEEQVKTRYRIDELEKFEGQKKRLEQQRQVINDENSEVPRRQGQVVNDDNPGVPRQQGRGVINDNPGVPRRQGQGINDDNPGVPRRQGQGLNDVSPGVPRRQGRGISDDNPRVPRRQGRGVDDVDSEAPRREGRGIVDDIEFMWQPVPASDTNPGTSYRDRPFKQQAQHQKHLRRRPRDDSPSDESDQTSYVIPTKRRRHVSKTKDRNYESAMIDKFLYILNNMSSTDRPKLSFNTNVIPEFDPMCKEQTALTWLTKVEECAEIYGWDDKETIHYALPKLTGIAKSWYQGLPTIIYTWTQWENKIIDKSYLVTNIIQSLVVVNKFTYKKWTSHKVALK